MWGSSKEFKNFKKDRLPQEDPLILGWQTIRNGVSLITVYASHNGEGIDIESLTTTTIHEMIHAAGIHDHQTSNSTVTLQSWAVNEIKHPLIVINRKIKSKIVNLFSEITIRIVAL